MNKILGTRPLTRAAIAAVTALALLSSACQDIVTQPSPPPAALPPLTASPGGVLNKGGSMKADDFVCIALLRNQDGTFRRQTVRLNFFSEKDLAPSGALAVYRYTGKSPSGTRVSLISCVIPFTKRAIEKTHNHLKVPKEARPSMPDAGGIGIRSVDGCGTQANPCELPGVEGGGGSTDPTPGSGGGDTGTYPGDGGGPIGGGGPGGGTGGSGGTNQPTDDGPIACAAAIAAAYYAERQADLELQNYQMTVTAYNNAQQAVDNYQAYLQSKGDAGITIAEWNHLQSLVAARDQAKATMELAAKSVANAKNLALAAGLAALAACAMITP